MKSRDYLFLAVVTAIIVMGWHVTSPAPATPQARPALHQAGDWLAIWWLTREHAPAPEVQELPDHIVNAPARRVPGPDGQPLLDHGAGW